MSGGFYVIYEKVTSVLVGHNSYVRWTPNFRLSQLSVRQSSKVIRLSGEQLPQLISHDLYWHLLRGTKLYISWGWCTKILLSGFDAPEKIDTAYQHCVLNLHIIQASNSEHDSKMECSQSADNALDIQSHGTRETDFIMWVTNMRTSHVKILIWNTKIRSKTFKTS